jgi:membrane-associated phospholipid phosphatase
VSEGHARRRRGMGRHRARQSILREVADAGMWRMLLARLQHLDERTAHLVNASANRWPSARLLSAAAASWLANVEILLMLALGAGGRHASVVRMLVAVATVYAATEVLGMAWRRDRPFTRQHSIRELIAHRPGRSFPSRHVASALAMASIGQRAHPRLGRVMAVLGWFLGCSRIAAGVHYPSDVLAGALLGVLVGRLLRN